MDGTMMHETSLANFSGRGRKGYKQKRVGLFVDLSNIYLSARQLQIKLDYKALLDFAARRGKVTVARMYTAYNPEQQQARFFLNMKDLGFQIVREPLRSYAGENQGNLDTVIAFDIGLEASHLDEIILVSGDGDFAPVVKQMRYLRKWVTVIGLKNCTSANLIIESSEFVPASKVPGFIIEELISDQVTTSKSNETVIHSSANNGC